MAEPDVRTVHPNEIHHAQQRTLTAIEHHLKVIKGWIIFWSLMAFLGAGITVLALLAAVGTSS